MLVSELIEETRRILLSGQREEQNRLTTAITSSDTSLTVTYDVGSIDRGSKLSIDLEDMYVWGKSSQTITPIDRGQFGSSPASHSINSLIRVNSKFSNLEIFNAINDELTSLTSATNGIFLPFTLEFSYLANTTTYEFGDDVIDVLDVRYRLPGSPDTWLQSHDWEFSRALGGDFANGRAIVVRDAYPGQPFAVTVKLPFTTLPASMTANTTLFSIPNSIIDILTIGAAWRLVSTREVRRNFDEVQGDTRRAEEVPPGANLGASRELGRLRQQRINEEASRLSQLYPAHSRRYPFPVGGW